MPRSISNRSPRPSRRSAAPGATLAALALVAILASAALAVRGARAHAAATRVLGAANVAALGKSVAVDVHGRTLYALHPETAHHLLCKSRACLGFWPPLLVRSASAKLTAGPGVSGRLGVIRRGHGAYQVTLRGLPPYRFSGDGAKGQANGEGIKSFGGTWHAVPTRPAASPPAAPAPAPMPAPYGY